MVRVTEVAVSVALATAAEEIAAVDMATWLVGEEAAVSIAVVHKEKAAVAAVAHRIVHMQRGHTQVAEAAGSCRLCSRGTRPHSHWAVVVLACLIIS